MSQSAPLLASQPEFDFEVESQADPLLVLEWRAREGLSRLYEVRVQFGVGPDVDLDVPSLIGKAAVLTVHSEAQSRFFQGIIARMTHVPGTPGSRLPKRYEATVVPRLWTLRHSSNCRIFQDMEVTQIIKAILDEHQVDHRLDLNGTYRHREYCVQYRETDLDFISRLMEEEGIAYRFEHEHDQSLMVLVDANSAYPDLAGDPQVKFNTVGTFRGSEVIHGISRTLELRSGSVAMRDFNFQRPAQDLSVQEDASGAEPSLQVYDYPGRYEASAEGQSLAKVRLQELRAGVDTVRGEGDTRRLVAGAHMELAEHPEEAFNQKYLLVEVEHQGRQPGLSDDASGEAAAAPPEAPPGEPPYQNHFVAIPSKVPYRPERLAPRPEIHGAQTATVVGAAGEEIDTDEHGRVKVQFHWSRADHKHPLTSCWLRVSQAWAGAGWGALWIPRIGHEVVVEFLEGDPDRPLVTGSVYNGANPPPIALPGQKTKSVVRSNSSPGGSGSNELRFEDAAGSEEVYLHAQKDLVIGVENDKTQTVGRDEKLQVGRDRALVIQGNQALQVKGNDQTTVGGNQQLHVDGNRTQTVGGNDTTSVTGDRSLQIDGVHSVSVLMAATEQVALAKSVSVGGAYEVVGAFKSEQIGGSKSEAVGGDKKETVGGARTLHVKGEMTEEVVKNRSLKVHKDLHIGVGGKLNEQVKGTYSVSAKELNLVAEDTLVIKVGSATITLKKSGDVVIKGAKVELNSSGDIVLQASKISEN